MEAFGERLQVRLASAKQAPAPSGANTSFINELERLVALRRADGLTEEEFQAAKRKLLGL